MENNIFYYATSELTHDAILLWILSWGNKPTSPLYMLSKEFIGLMTGKDIDFEKIELHKQVPFEKSRMDIIVELDEENVLLIEDKVEAYQTGDQLSRYKTYLNQKYNDRDRFYCYLTIGDECSYEGIEKMGYKVVRRKEIIQLIKGYTQYSEILENYYTYLISIDNDYESYKTTLNLEEWTSNGWKGFFSELKKEHRTGEWSYVNNSSGGFIAFYWKTDGKRYDYKNVEGAYSVYLQIENNKIAMKVAIDEIDAKEYRTDIRNRLWGEVITNDFGIVKPKRFGDGNTMTFAEIRDISTKEGLYTSMKAAEEMLEIIEKELSHVSGKK